ncbi:hypothetical protein RHSIM_Rhsim07G0249100 [Rhododendron simsii]|uniref:Uncharacterized protein n=1 Tax=Rhododendron simsii TaxID=118357 RepID=A0A834GN63_RHOSS|nr:hypothetical protein RHSIM_Rhsim07G0249100 [Rhododendron simsii]
MLKLTSCPRKFLDNFLVSLSCRIFNMGKELESCHYVITCFINLASESGVLGTVLVLCAEGTNSSSKFTIAKTPRGWPGVYLFSPT